MILLKFSYFLLIAYGKIQDKNDLNILIKIPIFSELSNTHTECIEFCTSLCLNNSDVYTCFDKCALEKCNETDTIPQETKISSTYTIFIVFFILSVLGLTTTIWYYSKFKYDDNYWPLLYDYNYNT